MNSGPHGHSPAHRRRVADWIGTVVVLAITLAAIVYERPMLPVGLAVKLYLRTHGVHSRNVSVEGERIHYLEAGSGSRDVVLVHGLGAQASDWLKVIPMLASAGYHVYAPDLLGYGTSARPKNGDYSVEHEADVVAGFMDAAGIPRADVGGWSMGGWVATLLALHHPERVHTLMLYDNAGMYQRVNFPVTLFTPTDRASLDALMARLEPDRPTMHVPAFAVHGLLRGMARNRAVIEKSLASMLNGRSLLEFRVWRLNMPVLIVWGEQDRLLPVSDGIREHQLVRDSRFVPVPGCGHLLVAECSGPVFDATLEFLRSHAGKR